MQLLGVRVYWTIKVAMAEGSGASASDEERSELVLTLINCCGVYQYTVSSFPVFNANGLIAT